MSVPESIRWKLLVLEKERRYAEDLKELTDEELEAELDALQEKERKSK